MPCRNVDAKEKCVGKLSREWGEQVAAVVRPADPLAPPSSAELHDLCRARLAPHKTPRFWYQTDQFPLTGSGKVQKFRIVGLLKEDAYRPLS
jgi:fatty-acyl-CoA synthase